jgi:NitT/TauT family transport system substrate-binding protein
MRHVLPLRSIGLLLAALALCTSPALAQSKKLTRVTFVTDWKAQAEHGGFYEALAGGAADFGMGSNGFIQLNMLKAGIPAKSVMGIFQKDPQVLITHPRPDVKKLADMKGKPIMLSDAATTAYWPWLKAKYGFSDSQIRKYTFNLAPFLVDKTAIQQGYVTSEPYTIEKTGRFKPQVFLLADNGYPGYANLVMASQKMIDSNPKIVQAFVDATRAGWLRYLLTDPKPGNALIKRDNPEMTDDVIAQGIARMKSYGIVLSGDGKTFGLGSMTDNGWRTFFQTMATEGLYDKNLPYKNAYDLRFIRKAPQNFE